MDPAQIAQYLRGLCDDDNYSRSERDMFAQAADMIDGTEGAVDVLRELEGRELEGKPLSERYAFAKDAIRRMASSG